MSRASPLSIEATADFWIEALGAFFHQITEAYPAAAPTILATSDSRISHRGMRRLKGDPRWPERLLPICSDAKPGFVSG
jgi:hypothetical protein